MNRHEYVPSTNQGHCWRCDKGRADLIHEGPAFTVVDSTSNSFWETYPTSEAVLSLDLSEVELGHGEGVYVLTLQSQICFLIPADHDVTVIFT